MDKTDKKIMEIYEGMLLKEFSIPIIESSNDMVKKLLAKFGDDPLYKKVILAKDKKEQESAIKTLVSIRGKNSMVLMQKFIKDN
jgi:hypothetical protein